MGHRPRRSDAMIRQKLSRLTKGTETSATITGIFFNDPFFAIPAPPPWAAADPCWSCWQAVNYWGKQLIRCGPLDADHPESTAGSQECLEIRRQFFDAGRAYATCMDRVYGLKRTAHSTKPSAT